MSYILDALRRADSERERERSAVPGLNAQAVPAGAPDAEDAAPTNPWKWPIVAAFIALLGLVAWLWWGRGEGPGPGAAPASAPPPMVAAPAPAAVAPVSTARTSEPAAAGAITAASAVPATPAAPAREPAPSRKAPANTAATAARKPPATASAVAAAPKPAAKPSEPEVPISKLNELPDDVRRELPAITVGGSIYSKSAANRMLVINGQVFHEGDELAPALVLEQIRQKSAVLKYKSYRYEISY